MQMDARTELMVIMMEECGELIQACSKVLRRNEFYDNQQLIEEVGDVYTMIEIMHDFDMISWNDIEDRVKEKRIKLSKWSQLLEEWEVEEDQWESEDNLR
jgi:NTP pyrophosphatase (non-canonical NTP hydrolase)|tara:strand:+ start:1694 stop:1993 length:300 start_codon:yes stop_codon:yes gene_type:complete